MVYRRKNIFVMTGLALSFAATAFAQQELRDAVDAGDVATVQKMVKKGQVEEIYCGELSPNDAVKVYEKIFKAMPGESFESCPNQFVYGYGVKACSNGKDTETCLKVTNKLIADATAGNANAIETLGSVAKSALKTKAYAKSEGTGGHDPLGSLREER